MIYFSLPKIYNNLKIQNILLSLTHENIDNFLNKKLSQYLLKSKHNIDNYIDNWDSMKKYTNSYEFIHTSIPEYKYCISKYVPISRAFYKMIEIMNVFELNVNKKISSFHLAEAPGGFIEALCYLREKYPDETYRGISLLDDKNTTPNWRNNSIIFNKYKNKINIENGVTNDGDLYKKNNFLQLQNKYGNSMDLITADGGFDFSLDYNMQEKNMLRLIYTEILYAIVLQKKGGNFILKIFDIFLQQTLEMMYFLSLCYDQVFIIKPSTSRSANSEKYVVCKGFKLSSSIGFMKLFYNQLEYLETGTNNTIFSIFQNITIPNMYVNTIREINSIIGQNQLENINSTIMMIEQPKRKERLKLFIKENIARCIEWCKENNIEYENNIDKINIFLKET